MRTLQHQASRLPQYALRSSSHSDMARCLLSLCVAYSACCARTTDVVVTRLLLSTFNILSFVALLFLAAASVGAAACSQGSEYVLGVLSKVVHLACSSACTIQIHRVSSHYCAVVRKGYQKARSFLPIAMRSSARRLVSIDRSRLVTENYRAHQLLFLRILIIREA